MPLSPLLPLLPSLVLLFAKSAMGAEYRIKNANDFYTFVNNVNTGLTFLGTTVFLDSDLSLPEVTDPVGNKKSNYFQGVFDGQGHVISNLSIASAPEYFGLFGYSTGLTVKNVVLDASCSVESSYIGDKVVYVGGIVGLCGGGQCTVENTVNMATVAFSGDVSSRNAYLGGIAGNISSGSIKNCANYGPVTYSGKSGLSYIGGIAGGFRGSCYNCLNDGSINSEVSSYVGGIVGNKGDGSCYNCFNYGSINTGANSRVGGIVGNNYGSCYNCFNYGSINTGANSTVGGIVGYNRGSSTNSLNYGPINAGASSTVGGIVGYSSWGTITNCESGGRITSTSSTIGSIVGEAYYYIYDYEKCDYTGYSYDYCYDESAEINYGNYYRAVTYTEINIYTTVKSCYYTSEVSGYKANGTGLLTDDSRDPTNKGSSPLSLDSLNSYSSANGLSKWLLNINSAIVTFKADNSIGYSISSRVIIIPDITSNWRSFAGWFRDSAFALPFNESSVSNDTTLYGRWDKYLVNLDVNGGSEVQASKVMTYGSTYGSLPATTREGYTFDGWFTDRNGGSRADPEKEVLAFDHTLYAHWSINKYTISFEPNGGSTCTSITQYYNSLFTLPKPSRAGYTFVHWCSDASLASEYKATQIEPKNVTLYALWNPNTYTLSFDPRCGDSKAPVAATYDGTYDIPVPARGGCNFLWWDVEGTQEKVRNGMAVKVVSDQTLCAVWDTNPVTLNAMGGSVGVASVNATYNKTYPNLPTPTRTGHEFLGWFKDEARGSAVASETRVETPYPHTLYAGWDPISYALTFDLGYESKAEVKTFFFNESIKYLNDVQREGYSFDGWSENPEFMPAGNITVTAQWRINQYTITFDLGNGTTLVQVADYGANIIYPEDPVREGYNFEGWESKHDVVPASNLTINARWAKTLNSGISFTPLIIGVSAAMFIIVVIAVSIVLVIFVFFKKKVEERIVDERRFELDRPLIGSDDTPADEDSHYRIVLMASDQVENNILAKNNRSLLTHLYPKGYVKPTMKEALLEADLTEKKANMVCSACESVGGYSLDEGKLFEDFTEEDAAAIAMYTYDFGLKDFEDNPYRIINKSLVGRNYANLQKARGLLYLVMTALRKLPRVMEKTLYRGVRGKVSLDEDHYIKGNVVTWPALSSTSPDMDETKKFLAKGSRNKKATGTLFIIEKGWGYDIQPYSLFPDEAEILIEPERQFKVTSVIQGDLTIINLQMLDTSLALPGVFGSEW